MFNIILDILVTILLLVSGLLIALDGNLIGIVLISIAYLVIRDVDK